MDFKLRASDKLDPFEYLYECMRCGRREWYMVKLPPHLTRQCHIARRFRRCSTLDGAALDMVATRRRR
jgi:hypothetical protein